MKLEYTHILLYFGTYKYSKSVGLNQEIDHYRGIRRPG